MAALLAIVLLGAPTGTLTIESEDYGATVVVDRWPIGIIPVEPERVAAGLHLVEVLRDGRPVWVRLVFVPGGGELRLPVALPARTLPPWRSAGRSSVAPRYGLSAAVGAEVSGVGDRVDLDLVQRYRLEADDVPLEGLSAAVEAWVFSDLIDRGGELRWAPRPAGTVHVEEARLRYAGALGRADAGRMVAVGPGGRAFVLDGAQGALGGDRIEVHARGGRRYEAIGPAPDAWLAGGGLRAAPWGDAMTATVEVLHHARLHVDGALAGRWGRARARIDGRSIGDRLAAVSGGAGLDGEVVSARVEGGVRTDARGPFETPRWALGLTDLVSPAGWWVAGRGQLAQGPWQAGGRVEWRDGAGAASAVHPDRWTIDVDGVRALGAGRVGVQATALIADVGDGPPSPALRQRLGVAALGDQTLGPVRVSLRIGVERLAIGETERALPTGDAGIRWALTDGLELDASAGVRAVHPTLYPDGGPLWIGRLGLRLR